MKAMKWCVRFFFSPLSELKLWINSSKASTYQLFVFVFTKSDLSLILDFISLFQTDATAQFCCLFLTGLLEENEFVTNQTPFPKSQCSQKEREKKMKTAVRFYCATSKNTLVVLCLMHCTALPRSLLFPSSTAELPGPAPLLSSTAASSFCHQRILPYP